MKRSQIASLIDHTLLAPEAGVRKITTLCAEAKNYGFASVCVNPVYVKLAAGELEGCASRVCSVVGFPLGAATDALKAAEAKAAVEDGADEIDMVIPIGAAADGLFNIVEKDIQAVVEASKEAGAKAGKKIIVKTILETCLLDESAIVTCCECAKKAGADFVKTSTGFATPKALDGQLLPNGASARHVALMRKTVGESMGVKASGGIRTPANVIAMLEAGANRIGASSGTRIVDAWDENVKVKGWD